ncbi:MAG TPA: cytochrome c, partial [Solirubrobacteraceae bacterium]|nr:cytochrome c [Solirubrobacteraceae bacterium]
FFVFLLAAPSPRAQSPEEGPTAFAPGTERERQLVAEGRRLFVDGCSSCHGFDARGIPDRAPSLHGVGAQSADFYLRTGRMPLDDPEDEPRRKESFYTQAQRRALVAYVHSLGGPPIPKPAPERGDLPRGRDLFARSCAGCHQIAGRGGITPRAVVPDLEHVAAVDIYEAMNVGPYVMPKFEHLTTTEQDSIARYVLWAQDPADLGGWGIGHIGPIPEGMVTFFIGLLALLLTIRAIGERTTE